MDTPDGTVARRVGVLGAAGRMGRTTCDAVAAAPDLDLVAVADPMAVGDEVVLLGSQGEACVRPEEVADAVGSIAYEVLTSVGARVPRRH